MNKLRQSFHSFFLTSLCLFALALSVQVSAAQVNGTIYGGSNPLAGVTLMAFEISEDEATATIVTDSNGTYQLALPDGTYNLLVQPPVDSGFANTSVNDVAVAGADVIQNVVLITTASKLSGIVRDGNGLPISNISFKINDLSSGVTIASLVSGSDGAYSVGLPNGRYEIDVHRFGGANPNRPFPSYFVVWPLINDVLVAGDTSQDLNLPFVTLTGKTVDSNGVPVPGVKIDIDKNWSDYSAGYRQYKQLRTSSMSDENGDYSLVVLAGLDALTLIAPVDSGLANTIIDNLILTTDISIDLPLAFENRLSGIVRDGNGLPISNISFKINDLSSGVTIASLVSGSDGAYSVGLPNGRYEIDVHRFGGANPNRPFPSYFVVWPLINDVLVAGDTSQDLNLPFVTLTGKTVDSNGVSVPGVKIDIDKNWSDYSAGYRQYKQLRTSSISDENGDYSLVALVGLDSETILPPANSGFAQTVINGLNLQSNINQQIVLPFIDTQIPEIISGPFITDITDNSAVIEWQTNEPTTTVVNGDLSTTNEGFRTIHSMLLTGLDPETSYSISVSGADEAGNGPVTSSLISFTTQQLADTTAPSIIAGPIVTNVADTTVTIEWETSEAATGDVSYGIGSLTETQSQLGESVVHKVVLSGLTANSQYDFKVSSTDRAGNGPTQSPVLSFRTKSTPDNVAPVITHGPLLSSVTDVSVTVSWITDEPSNSGVSYNDGTAYGVVTDNNMVLEHQVQITGLSPETPYTFTVSSSDINGNGPTLSEPVTISTLPTSDTTAPTFVQAPKACTVNHQLIRLCWDTDEPSNALVEYGTSADFLDQNEAKTQLIRHHSLPITGLESGVLYYFRVRATDALGNEVVSELFSAKTSSQGVIASPQFKELPTISYQGRDRVVISWETDVTTSGAVECSSANGYLHAVSPSKPGQRKVTLTNLVIDTEYTCQVTVLDGNGQVSSVAVGGL